MRRLLFWLAALLLLPAAAACPMPPDHRASAEVTKLAMELTIASDIDLVKAGIAGGLADALALLPRPKPPVRFAPLVTFWASQVQPRLDGYAAASRTRATIFAWLDGLAAASRPAAPQRALGRVPRLLDIAREARSAPSTAEKARLSGRAAMRAIVRAHR